MKKLIYLVLGKRGNAKSARDKAIKKGMQDAMSGMPADSGSKFGSAWHGWYMIGYNHGARGII